LGALKDAVSNPLFDAALGLALPGVGSAITGALGAIPGIGGALASGADAVGSALGSAGGLAKEAVSAIPGAPTVASEIPTLAKDAGSWLTSDNGKKLLGLAQGITTTLQQKKANDLANRALQSAEGAYGEKAPLRAAGLAGLASAGVGNPYAASA
jgi:hypothetical protein